MSKQGREEAVSFFCLDLGSMEPLPTAPLGQTLDFISSQDELVDSEDEACC
jgi:hypothetical protein